MNWINKNMLTKFKFMFYRKNLIYSKVKVSIPRVCSYSQTYGNNTDYGQKDLGNDHQEQERIGQLYDTHIPTTIIQKTLLGAGSAFMSLYSPYRDDMVAVMGETTGQFALPKMYRAMLQDPEGQKILRERPRINSSTVDLDYLRTLPDDSLGHLYTKFLDDNNVTPDSRLPVQFVDDHNLAYVMQRYREVHDLIHTVLGMPTNMLGEVAVKWVEALQTGLPMCILGSIFGPLRFAPKQRQNYAASLLPWAIRCGFKSKSLMNVYFEKRWTQPITELRYELDIENPPAVPQKRKK